MKLPIILLAALLLNVTPTPLIAQSTKSVDSGTPIQETISKSNASREAKIAALTVKIKEQSNDPLHYRNRGLEYAKVQAWKKAADDFMRYESRKGGTSYIGTQVGVLLLLSEDDETYRELCEEMLAGQPESATSADLERTVKLCALPSKPIGDLNNLLEKSRKGLANGRKFKYAVNHYRTLALVQYRAKRYDEALNTIRVGVARNGRATFKNPSAVVGLNIIKAMCLLQQSKQSDAKQLLTVVKNELDKVFEDEDKFYEEPTWHDWLFNKILHQEAEGRLGKANK